MRYFLEVFAEQLKDQKPPTSTAGILGEAMGRPAQLLLAALFIAMFSRTAGAQQFFQHSALGFGGALGLCVALRAACTGYVFLWSDMIRALSRFVAR